MTADFIQYLAEWMPDAIAECSGCTREVEINRAVIKGERVFHSMQCAEISTSPIIKPQPKGDIAVMPNGAIWDI